MSKKLAIDREFRSLIPALTEEELALLEESLKREGCRDPLVTWQGKILDGHQRYEFCNSHGIEFKTKEAKIKDRTEAKVWIIKNQFGRRNLKPFQRCELALKLKPLIATQAKEHQKLSKGRGQKGLIKKINLIDTEKELAKIAGVSKATMNKARFILDHGNAEEMQRSREDKATIHKAKIDIKRRLMREEYDRRAAEFDREERKRQKQQGDLKITYYTDKWGNKRKREVHRYAGHMLIENPIIKENLEYTKLLDGETGRKNWRLASDLVMLRVEIMLAIQRAEKMAKYKTKDIKEAYQFDYNADSLESAKKFRWPEIIKLSKKLIGALSKLEDAETSALYNKKR